MFRLLAALTQMIHLRSNSEVSIAISARLEFELRKLITALLLGSKKKGTLPPMESKPNQENILNAILPPREWIENAKHYI